MIKISANDFERGRTKYITRADEVCLNLKYYKDCEFKENEFVQIETSGQKYLAMVKIF